MYHSEFWLNLHGIWNGWPSREVEGVFKFYYLLQWAFYIQQILVVNIEEKRKDYAQMFVHHVFTAALLFLSYGYYHMRVGLVIMCIMDFIDIILPVSTQRFERNIEINTSNSGSPQNYSSTWAIPPLVILPLASSSSLGSSPDTFCTCASVGLYTAMRLSTWHPAAISRPITPPRQNRHPHPSNHNSSYQFPTPLHLMPMAATVHGSIC